MSDLADFKRRVYEPQQLLLRAVQKQRDDLAAEVRRLERELASARDWAERDRPSSERMRR